MYSIFYIDVGIYIVSGIPCGMSRSWPAESRWDPWWNRWDPRHDFIQGWQDPDQDYGLPQVGSRLGSHLRLAGSRVGSHPRRSIILVRIPPGIPPIPPGIPPGIKMGFRVGSHPRRSIIPVRIPPIPPGIPTGIKTGSWVGLAGSRLTFLPE